LQLQNNPVAAAAQVANLPKPAVVPTPARLAAAAARRFFERRSRLMISVPASPSASRIAARGRKPACLYTSNKRRFGFDPILMPKRDRFSPRQNAGKLNIHSHPTRYDAPKSPTRIHEEPV
jgi:hypothetical protein